MRSSVEFQELRATQTFLHQLFLQECRVLQSLMRAGLGAIEMKAMHDKGFDDEFSAAVTAASSTIGPIIPPPYPMVVYGVAAEVSVGKLFMGA
jgi:TRAP-type mannitol/chloroaromatic compound transport system permease large subunit